MKYLGCLLLLFASTQTQDKALPEAKPFIEEFRKTLREDSALLREYTYTEKETEITLDSKGQVKKSESNTYQVINAAEDWRTYRRHVSKNDIPLTEQELAKQDRKEEERVTKEARKRANQSESKRQREKEKTEKEQRETLDDIFSMYDIQLLRRETVEDVTAILLTFKSKPNYKPKTSAGKILQHISGRAWIAEDDHELVRIEGEVISPISIGAGILAKLNKGSTLAFQRRKINNEIWLPVRAEFLVNARILLLKGVNERNILEYSDHRKYTVESLLKVGAPVELDDNK